MQMAKAKAQRAPAERDHTGAELLSSARTLSPPPAPAPSRQACVCVCFLKKQPRLPLVINSTIKPSAHKPQQSVATTNAGCARGDTPCVAVKTCKRIANVISPGRRVGLPVGDKLVWMGSHRHGDGPTPRVLIRVSILRAGK